jgi:hypothetical protein
MRILLTVLTLLVLTSCDHNLKHDRVVKNDTGDTVTVFNPDFIDITHVILPGQEAIVYSFKNLDTKQEMEPCKWLGDTLIIKNTKDSICAKFISFESSWVSVMGGTKKERHQTCTFTVDSTDLGYSN